jgi:hypothetical protein
MISNSMASAIVKIWPRTLKAMLRVQTFVARFKAPPCGRRAALFPMQPQALARGVRPPAGPRAARGCATNRSQRKGSND